jgi:Carboxypeptidase regulatory-like domain
VAGVLLIASSLLWLSPASAQQSSAGLYGTVTKSPASPVCVAEHPCTAPAAGAKVEALRGQTVVARTTTGRKGGYRLPLSPGRYVVRIVGAFRGGRKNAVVQPRTWTRLNLTFDTGIR